jgi:hypothetical protein
MSRWGNEFVLGVLATLFVLVIIGLSIPNYLLAGGEQAQESRNCGYELQADANVGAIKEILLPAPGAVAYICRRERGWGKFTSHPDKVTAAATVIIAVFTVVLGMFTISLSRSTRVAANAA